MVQEMNADLKKWGITVQVSHESAARADQLAAIDDYIRSPLTTVPDKIEAIDSLILRNLQWGMGRTDMFWDEVYDCWKRIYSNWLWWLSHIESYGVSLINMEFEEYGLTLDDATETWTSRNITVRPETVAFYFLQTKRYRNVRVVSEQVQPPTPRKFESPNINTKRMKESVMNLGRESVLQDGMYALNLIYHPDHVNPKFVTVVQALPQQQAWGQGAASASDFTGSRPPPPNTGIPGKIQQ